MKLQAPPVQPMPTLSKRRQLVRFWKIGLALMLFAIVSDMSTQTWQELSRAGSLAAQPAAVFNLPLIRVMLRLSWAQAFWDWCSTCMR